MNSRISCYLVSKNYGRFLDDCLASLLPQVSFLHELVLVDVGSDDNSFSVFQHYLPKFEEVIKNVKIIKLDELNLLQVMDRIVYALDCDYFFRLDADDFLEPHFLKTVSGIIARENVDLLYCGYNIVDIKSCLLGKQLSNDCVNISFPPNGACTLISRNLLGRIPSYSDLGLNGQDGLINFITAKRDALNVNHIIEPLFNYRQHNSSLTSDPLSFNQKRIAVLSSFPQDKEKINILNCFVVADDWIGNVDVYHRFKEKYFDGIFPILTSEFQNIKFNVFIVCSADTISYLKQELGPHASSDNVQFTYILNEHSHLDHFYNVFSLVDHIKDEIEGYIFVDLLSKPILDDSIYILAIYYLLSDMDINLCVSGLYSYKISVDFGDDFLRPTLPPSLSRSVSKKRFVLDGGLFAVRDVGKFYSSTFTPLIIR